MIVVFVILVHGLLTVSQGIFTVEVNVSEESVLLPCQIRFVSEVTALVWSRKDLSPSTVHQYQQEGGELKDQNGRYRGRTSVRSDALETGNLSLTLKKIHMSDRGIYTCTIRKNEEDKIVKEVQLQVKVHVSQPADPVEKYVGESVQLPCLFHYVSENSTVEWSRNDLSPSTVHLHHQGDEIKDQNQGFRGRTSVRTDALETGDLSLNLTELQLSDGGTYTCSVREFEQELKVTEVQLQVKEQFPFLTTIFLVLPVLLVSVALVLPIFMSVQQVEVDSGVGLVLLPFKNIRHRLEIFKVEWKDRGNRIVHVYHKSPDQPEEQNQFYRNRTEMKRNLLQTGDLSLTLKHPTEEDRGTYTCTVYRSGESILIKKQVKLRVRVPQVVVDSEAESVQLPCVAAVPLPEDARVEWTDRYCWKVHVYQTGSDRPEEQNKFYRDRTKMERNQQEPGDYSLTLKYPTDRDGDTFTCTVYSRERNILMRKQVELKVEDRQVEVEEGVESVQLPFITTGDLPEDARVEWNKHEPKPIRLVHKYQKGSEQPEEQNQLCKRRTKLNEDPLRTGDLSLTLKYPTDGDTGTYRCGVWSRDTLLRERTVVLSVKVHQVEVEEGVASVQLPFHTHRQLEDAKVVWRREEPRPTMMVCMYRTSSEQPEQDEFYKNRAEIEKTDWTIGDFSLILKNLTDKDTGRYRCEVSLRQGIILREKTVLLKVTERTQDKDKTVDIRNSSCSTDPTPLLADQLV